MNTCTSVFVISVVNDDLICRLLLYCC